LIVGWTAQGPDGIDHRVAASWPLIEKNVTEVITSCGLLIVVNPWSSQAVDSRRDGLCEKCWSHVLP
jgi:hypothetical protein